MKGYDASTYGDGFAEVYDRWYHDVTDTDACVARLTRLATGTSDASSTTAPPGTSPGPPGLDRPPPRVLELGAGTGRLALPLAAGGLEVTALDASADMLAALAAEPGADRLALVHADMADLAGALGAGDRFALVLAAYNTFFNLPTTDAQATCIRAVAAHLEPGGCLVIEAFVPAVDRDARRDSVAVSRIDAGELVLNATLHDPDAQTITGQHVQITEGGIRLRPWVVHYLHPGQLDALAAAAGLALDQRTADWSAAPFDDTSPVHVSVYRRPS